jgi:uncharacterized protein (DUF305 family)
MASLLIIGLAVFLLAACGTQSVKDRRDEQNRAANVQASPESHGAVNAPMAHDSMHGGHAMMDHAQMHSSPGAEKAPYDLQFIDTMILHHQGAIEMARLAGERAEHRELKELARKIIEDQEREIAQMRAWRERWYKGQAPAVNMELPGMRESMMMDMQKLSAARGRDFDLLFIDMMIPHHEGAVVMSRQALERAEHAELKKLAEQIIAAQQAEIAQMRKWRTEWGK